MVNNRHNKTSLYTWYKQKTVKIIGRLAHYEKLVSSDLYVIFYVVAVNNSIYIYYYDLLIFYKQKS
jgi:hypothetical protein